MACTLTFALAGILQLRAQVSQSLTRRLKSNGSSPLEKPDNWSSRLLEFGIAERNIGELLLWHGTTPDVAHDILFGLGFDASYTNESAFGVGCYFAENCKHVVVTVLVSKVDEYAQEAFSDVYVHQVLGRELENENQAEDANEDRLFVPEGCCMALLCRVAVGNIYVNKGNPNVKKFKDGKEAAKN